MVQPFEGNGKKDVSIIIISYNTSDILRTCLDSILTHTKDIDYEVIVVDNASTDASCMMIKKDYEWVKLVELQTNIGFGKANNLAFGIAKGKVLFLLNSDTLLVDNSVKILYDFLNSKPDIGVCGGLLLTAELLPTFSYGYKLSLQRELLSFFNLQRKSFYSVNQPKDVDYVLGADMMVKREVIDKTQGFDPDFFLYCEDTEWSYRIWQSGYKIVFVPQARIIHLEGKSGIAKRTLNPKIIEEQWYSRFLYFEKVYNKRYSFYLYVLHLVRCFIASVVFFILGNKDKQCYWKNKRKWIINSYQRFTKLISKAVV